MVVNTWATSPLKKASEGNLIEIADPALEYDRSDQLGLQDILGREQQPPTGTGRLHRDGVDCDVGFDVGHPDAVGELEHGRLEREQLGS